MTDAESFHEYVRVRRAALGRVAYLLTGDAHLADDLVQLTLVRVAARWERVAAAGDPDGYVRRVRYTQHVSWWRRVRREASPVAELPERAVPDFAPDAATALAVRAALSRLAPRQRAVRARVDAGAGETPDGTQRVLLTTPDGAGGLSVPRELVEHEDFGHYRANPLAAQPWAFACLLAVVAPVVLLVAWLRRRWRLARRGPDQGEPEAGPGEAGPAETSSGQGRARAAGASSHPIGAEAAGREAAPDGRQDG